MSGKISELQEQLQMYQKINDKLNEDLQAVRKQLELERQGKDVVSQSEHQSLMDILKKEVLNKKRFEDLYDRASKQLEECRNQDKQKEIDELKLQLQDAKKKLSRPHLQNERQSNVPDAEIIKLRKAGNTVKAIETQTGVSTATINRVLKLNNVRVVKVYNNDDDTKRGNNEL